MTAIDALALSVFWMVFLLARDQRFIWRADQAARNAEKKRQDEIAEWERKQFEAAKRSGAMVSLMEKAVSTLSDDKKEVA